MPETPRSADPARIGPYRVQARLGAGGMGQVFLGRSPGGYAVAIKVVRPELADDAGFRRRFGTEVAAARSVAGLYTAPVVAADPDGDPPWLATAYVPGPSLYEAVTRHGALPTESVFALGAGLAEGLTAVHAAGLVHRDLKPGNVILASDGPRLIDFGIVRALDATSHTQTATVLGSAGFMSPEQALGGEIGPASDVFALGCVLGFAATGGSPFGEGPAHAVGYRIVHGEADVSGLPGSLAEVVTACLLRDAADRPGLAELVDRLAAETSGSAERQWLPEAHSASIARLRTRLNATLVEPEQRSEPEPSEPQPTSEPTAPPPATPADPAPRGSRDTDPTSITADVLLAKSFRTDAGADFVRVATGVHPCRLAALGPGAADPAKAADPGEVVDVITGHGCAEVLAGAYVEQPVIEAAPVSPVLVSVSVFECPDNAAAKAVYEYLSAGPVWRLTMWHRQAGTDIAPFVAARRYQRRGHWRFARRYVVMAVAYRADLISAKDIAPQLGSAASAACRSTVLKGDASN